MRNAVTLPDFIIAGAPRSGTTWLCRALCRHPFVYVTPSPPEPKFFNVDENYAKGIEHYIQTYFPNIDAGIVAGEKSTNYLESEVAASRIAKDRPDVKLIFLLRDPVERAFSNWLWSRMNGVESEDFETALRLEQYREEHVEAKLRYARPHALFSRGLYADLLQPWLERFPREHLLFLRYEAIPHDPEGLIASVHRFLGVAERPSDVADLGVVNKASGEGSETMPAHVREALQRAYAEPNRRLARLLPDFPVWGDIQG